MTSEDNGNKRACCSIKHSTLNRVNLDRANLGFMVVAIILSVIVDMNGCVLGLGETMSWILATSVFGGGSIMAAILIGVSEGWRKIYGVIPLVFYLAMMAPMYLG